MTFQWMGSTLNRLPCLHITFTETDPRAARLLFTVVVVEVVGEVVFLAHQATEQQWAPECFLLHQATEPERSEVVAEHVKLRSPP